MHICSEINFLDLGHIKVCQECGRTLSGGLDARIGTLTRSDACMYTTHYSRVNRFLKLMDQLLLPTACKKDEPVLRYLKNKKLQTLFDLREALRLSKLKDKRYCSIHLYAALFCSDYCSIEIPLHYHEFKKDMKRKFLDLEFAHRRSNYKPFFNYSWLLHFLLNKTVYAPYTKYIKKIKCLKRRLKYTNMWKDLAVIHRQQFRVGTE